jgi:hypothetical protein
MPAAAPLPKTRKRPPLLLAGAAILIAAGAWMVLRPSGSASLPPFAPPVYLGAVLESEASPADIPGASQRVHIYSVKAETEKLMNFYRSELMGRGLKMTAQGGGPYGGFLQASDSSGRRTVFVEVDAPEDKPGEAAKITVRVIDKN